MDGSGCRRYVNGHDVPWIMDVVFASLFVPGFFQVRTGTGSLYRCCTSVRESFEFEMMTSRRVSLE
jgi:hypothetical protein